MATYQPLYCGYLDGRAYCTLHYCGVTSYLVTFITIFDHASTKLVSCFDNSRLMALKVSCLAKRRSLLCSLHTTLCRVLI
jgi:hypothetical protein